MAINLVRGDTAPQLKLTLSDALLPGGVLDLTGAAVFMHIRPVGSTVLSLTKTATVLAPTTGVAYINWATNDLLNIPAGNYEAEIEVYYSGTGVRQTVYDFVYLTIRSEIA